VYTQFMVAGAPPSGILTVSLDVRSF